MILSPTLNGLLTITIRPAIILPIVFIEAKPIIVPPATVKTPANTPNISTKNIDKVIDAIIKIVILVKLIKFFDVV
jgi:hypothetical protein